VRKWGVYEDVVVCAILREDWAIQRSHDPQPLAALTRQVQATDRT